MQIVIPAVEKALSLNTEDAITARSSCANERQVGYCEPFNYTVVLQVLAKYMDVIDILTPHQRTIPMPSGTSSRVLI